MINILTNQNGVKFEINDGTNYYDLTLPKNELYFTVEDNTSLVSIKTSIPILQY